MSNTSTTHDFVSWKSGDAALSGQRLSRIFYKSAELEKGKKNAAVSIPPITPLDITPEIMDQMKPHMMDFLMQTQDKIIRRMYENGSKTVNDKEISIAACFAFLDEENESNRLTAEKVKEWFTASLQDSLMLAFAEKLGIGDEPTPEQEKRINQSLNVYRDKFASLSSGRASFQTNVCDSLLSALTCAHEKDVIAARFKIRLEKMKAENTLSPDDLLL